MKLITSSFNRLSRNESFRLDFGMRFVDDVLDFNPLGLSSNFISLSEIMEELKSKKLKKGDLDESYKLVDLDNINKRFNSLINVEDVNSIESDKTILKNGDIVIAKMTPKLGTMFLNLDHNVYLGSTELVEYKIQNYDYLTVYYLLTSQKYLDALGYMESGKNQRRVKPSDLLKLKIPTLNKDFSNYISSKESDLKTLFSDKKDMQEIIDSSFRTVLGINTIDTNSQLATRLSIVGDDSFCRFSFHNQNYFKTFEFTKIQNNEWCPIEKKFVVKGGKRIPKGMSFSNSPTEFFYLRPTEVSILGLNKEAFPFISQEIHDILKRYSIDSGEYCISNVGTLGKVGLIHLDELEIEKGNLILSENFVKLTPISQVNETFYYYYFNSYIFQKQIDREYTITSIKKLGLDKIKKISIPNFSEEKEKAIIGKIESELDNQKLIIKKIDEVRQNIDSESLRLFSCK